MSSKILPSGPRKAAPQPFGSPQFDAAVRQTGTARPRHPPFFSLSAREVIVSFQEVAEFLARTHMTFYIVPRMNGGTRDPKDLFFQYYENYVVAKDRQDVHSRKLFAMLSIGQVHKLAGARYKDATESAKVIQNLFDAVYLTDQQALEMYQELYRDSRPT